MSTRLIRRIVQTEALWSPVVLRLIPGLVFAVHGAQKLFGWFGGGGLEGTAQWMESVGIAPAYPAALLAGSAEFFGGMALVLGILVRPAAAVLAITMLVAIFGVHFANGLFVQKNGYEYALALLIITLSLFVSGAGRASVDRMMHRAFARAAQSRPTSRTAHG